MGNVLLLGQGVVTTQGGLMFCTNCGLRMEAGDKFCARCGTPARINVPPVANIEETPPAAASQREEPPVQPAVRISRSTAEVAHQSLFHTTSFSDAARSARPQAEAAPQDRPAGKAADARRIGRDLRSDRHRTTHRRGA